MARAPAGLKGYITLTGATKTINRDLEAHQLWQIKKSFRISNPDLRARPIYHHQRDSIEANLAIVFAALAVSRLIERSTRWSIARFVKTFRRYPPVTIQAGSQTMTAADLSPKMHYEHLPIFAPGKRTKWRKSGLMRID